MNPVSLPQARFPFKFVTQVSLTQITKARAKSLKELMYHLKVVSGSVIYHHTHRFLKQHQFLSPEPPNDFAYWVNTALHDERLAEKLAAIDTIRFHTIRSLREKIILTLSEHMAHTGNPGTAVASSEFCFMQSISFVLPTTFESRNLEEFKEALKKISINSLYHHIFEARLRQASGTNDLSYWLQTSLNEKGLGEAISKMDPYTQTIEGLRKRIILLVEKRIQEIQNAASR